MHRTEAAVAEPAISGCSATGPCVPVKGSAAGGNSAKALSESYRMFRQGLLGFIRSRVHDPALAEDLLHEVFLKAIKALERDATPANMPAWLYRIASNVVIDHYRSLRPTDDLPEDLEALAPFRLPAEQTLALCLVPFIKELPDHYRDTLLATAIEGRSLADLSRELGLSQSAIKSRASRGRRLLRDKVLDCCHVELSAEGEVEDYHKRHS